MVDGQKQSALKRDSPIVLYGCLIPSALWLVFGFYFMFYPTDLNGIESLNRFRGSTFWLNWFKYGLPFLIFRAPISKQTKNKIDVCIIAFFLCAYALH